MPIRPMHEDLAPSAGEVCLLRAPVSRNAGRCGRARWSCRADHGVLPISSAKVCGPDFGRARDSEAGAAGRAAFGRSRPGQRVVAALGS